MYVLRAAKEAGIPVRIAHSHIANPSLSIKTPFRIYTKLLLRRYSTHNFACSIMAGKWLFGKKIYHLQISIWLEMRFILQNIYLMKRFE